MSLAMAAEAAHAALIPENAGDAACRVICGAASDSRLVKPGDLFVCIRGEKTDGHDHALSAVRSGAVALLAERPFGEEALKDTPVLLVRNSVQALGLLGNFVRQQYGGPVLGITGTAGKTSVKEMLAHILEARGPVARNPLNLNTQIGMPVSLLSTTGNEAFWVFEAGISRPKDMDELGAILEPDFALIINVGSAHTEGLGDRGVPYYKARLLSHVRPGGRALVCADYDDLVRESRKNFPAAVFFSAQGKNTPYRASFDGMDETGRGRYRLYLDGDSLDARSYFVGAYGAENVLAAAAAAHMLGIAPEDIARGIESAPAPVMRFNRADIQDGPLSGWTLIDDSYNANPLSIARMLESAARIARSRPLICVLGEMRELGKLTEQEHILLGRRLAEVHARAVFWNGQHAERVREGLEQGNFQGLFQPADNPDTFLNLLEKFQSDSKELSGGALILFKGSRTLHLENFVRAFREKYHAL